jgi:hypothetical protein
MKKSEFLQKLHLTVEMSVAKSAALKHDKDKMIAALSESILATMHFNGIKPPKWMQQAPRTMADGTTQMRDLRWRFSWEPELGTVIAPEDEAIATHGQFNEEE